MYYEDKGNRPNSIGRQRFDRIHVTRCIKFESNDKSLHSENNYNWISAYVLCSVVVIVK